MVGPFVVTKALGEDAVIRGGRRDRPRSGGRGSGSLSSDLCGRHTHTPMVVFTSEATRSERDRLLDLGPLCDPPRSG